MLSMWRGGVAPGVGGVPFLGHRVWNCVAACEWIAPWGGGWGTGWESGCCRVGSWLSACCAKGITQAKMLEEWVDRWKARFYQSDVVGVVLKSSRIQCAVECHTALMGRRSTSWGEEGR